ncbi:MAG: GntR family transcriptional regulator [Thermoanaerobaculia bacterium]
MNRRTIHIDPSDAVPIWKQIETEVRRLVASGILVPGAPVPSVRELARELRINPATVAKGYQQLTDAGLLTIKRGEGTFVSERFPTVSRGEKSKTLRDGAIRYASAAITADAALPEALAELESAWGKLQPATREKGQE